MTVYSWALLSVGLCVAATLECALASARKDPRLFTSMLFLALNWAALLPYYGLQAHPRLMAELGELVEFLPTYSGVLLFLTSGPLWREAIARRKMSTSAARGSQIGPIDVL